jgi:hypothetical protein
MISGMLWFDNDPKTDLPQKIDRAAQYYTKKYGQNPTLCFVNPKMIGQQAPEKTKEKAEIEVKASETILLHHLWLGIPQEQGS